jgi:hypothetical protein
VYFGVFLSSLGGEEELECVVFFEVFAGGKNINHLLESLNSLAGLPRIIGKIGFRAYIFSGDNVDDVLNDFCSLLPNLLFCGFDFLSIVWVLGKLRIEILHFVKALLHHFSKFFWS